MALTDRLVSLVMSSDVPLDREHVVKELRRIAPEEAPLANPRELAGVVDELVGLGPVEALLRDESISDVLVNGPSEVYVEIGGRLQRSAVEFTSQTAVIAAVERVIAPLGLRLDRSSPFVDARLPDGSRLHAIIPPASVGSPLVAIRRFTQAVPDFMAMVEQGGATPEQVGLLEELVERRANILVSGGTGTGKTTLLNLLSKLIPTTQRVVVIEDAAELRLEGHVVRLEARPSNSEGQGEITMTRLVRSALRLRPDRLVVGEVRGPEALDLVSALNTGHNGSMATLHANSPSEAVWRLETLALSGSVRLDPEVVRRQIDAAVHAIVQLERADDGARRIAAIEVRG